MTDNTPVQPVAIPNVPMIAAICGTHFSEECIYCVAARACNDRAILAATPQPEAAPATVEQRHREAAEEAASAANIVSHDGYYELEIDKVAFAFAKFERDHLPSAHSGDAALVEALRCAVGHIEHMAAWIGERNREGTRMTTYSFESLGEDMSGIKAPLATHNASAAPVVDEAKRAFTFAYARGFQMAEETSRSCIGSIDDVWEEYSALTQHEAQAGREG